MNIESVDGFDEMELDLEEDDRVDISSPIEQEGKTFDCRD